MQLKRRLMVVLAVISVTSSTAIAATKVIVKNGDNISGIAIKHHTTRNAIISANKLQNPDKLKLGQVLVIPSKAEIKKAELKKAKAVKLAAAKAHKQALIAKQKKQVALKAKHQKALAAKANHQKAIAAKAKAKTHTVAKKTSTPAKVASTKAGSSASKMVNTANRYKGVKYAWGGSSRSGFDCSGFTRYVVRSSVGKTLPHSSQAQFSKGTPVSKADLKPGDLVFFGTSKNGVSHVGIYAGNGKFVHASRPGSTVKTTSLNSAYYKNRYLGARRVSH